ncbi:ATP-dependent RNA helicase RhlE [Paracoccus seriniphilus]|uniref:ATP-dependent RNA helicase RhlE n=2 Tax=Paracoccus seriniphilus TaxID=184748 RepID=A0A239Q0S3_9RHOB|nr:ATP-dependent RNA helicase RhlE [Paracoccus seriniphilus]
MKDLMEQKNSRRRPARGSNSPKRSQPLNNMRANEGRKAPARDPLPTGAFADMGIDPRINANIAALGLNQPTPIQEKGIPAIVEGRDVLGLAQTGTGKTAAFGLPMLTRLIKFGKKPDPRTCRALILAPTRELATQIATNIDAYAEGTPIRSFRVVGGASINVQTERLSRGVDVLIATPGRLMDLIERRAISLEATTYLVLDEADQMLDIGFIHTLRKIARMLPRERQTLMFSATMPKLMSELSDTYLTNPVKVAVNPPGQAAKKIEQGVHFVSQGDKATLLAEYMSKHTGELAMVFGRTKHGCEKLTKLLDKWGFAVAAIHGNKSQGQRERALQAFRNGETKVLVATDVAARGLDIPDVAHVYNYDLPNVPENYVHRIGRTARAGREGRAVAFCAPAEVGELRAIERAMKAPIPVIGGEVPTSIPAAARGGRMRGKPMDAGGQKRPARRPSRKPRNQQA